MTFFKLTGFITIVLLLLTLLFSPSLLAKKRCKPFLEKRHNIQAMQRNGYSLKRGQSLRGKEDKARDKWWDCERISLAKFNKKYGGSKKKKGKSKQKVTTAKREKKRKKSLKILPNTYKSNITFNQGSAIVIRSAYQGHKQKAWLAFYKKPIKCQQPKNLSIFASCHEDKRLQQGAFETQYEE